MVLRPLLLTVGALALASAFATSASAAGGDYAFDGGTPAERATVRAALDASAFDWGVVRATVTIHVGRAPATFATPGHVWLERRLLASGTFAWAFVQHEYAHQVDFLLFDAARREYLRRMLGGRAWCHGGPVDLPHEAYGCERFASTLSWAYWPSRLNALRPQRTTESAAMAPARFRRLVSRLLEPSSPTLFSFAPTG